MIRSAMSQGRTLPVRRQITDSGILGHTFFEYLQAKRILQGFQLSTPDIRFICNIAACSSIKGTDEHVLLVSGVITLPTPPHFTAPN